MKKTFRKAFRPSLQAMVFAMVASVCLSSCIIVSSEYDYGPNGNPGKAFYGIDYDFNAPYSYWDNNQSVPDNPWFGEMYRTSGGIYDFEYFINPWEYWYGTYELRQNPGQPGQPYGEPGFDGNDSYLLLICNDDGFYFEDWESCDCIYRNADGTVTVDIENDKQNFKIVMKKTTIHERPAKGLDLKFKK